MKTIKIGITHGDYNGVGYEVILKTLSDQRLLELFTPIIYGSTQLYNYHKKSLKIDIDTSLNVISDVEEAREGMINLLELDTSGVEMMVQYGEVSRTAGEMAARALRAARNNLLEGTIEAVVTAPINKDAIRSSGFQFNGHTEFFAEPFNGTDEPTMLFCADSLKVALVTMHHPIAEVSGLITTERLVKSIIGLEQALRQDFQIIKPRIAVLGLNPHAGENGLLGEEEMKVIAPAVEQAWESGRQVFGPFPADGFWGSGTYQHFDAVLAMYHDQGLIPFKLLAMEKGVNITAGLPIIRTSPDHGTAFDIAGKGIAREESLRNAIYAAIDIYNNRCVHKEANADPLRKRYVERGSDNVRLDFSESEDELL